MTLQLIATIRTLVKPGALRNADVETKGTSSLLFGRNCNLNMLPKTYMT